MKYLPRKLHSTIYGEMIEVFGCVVRPGSTIRNRDGSIKINVGSLMARLKMASILTAVSLVQLPFWFSQCSVPLA